ncbi:MAG: hypothetical protein ACLFWF_10570 [Alphaproteobacteria bacterium]
MTGNGKKSAGIRLKPTDWVLVGQPGITMPCDWFAVRVLWADDREMLVEHETPSDHETVRQVMSLSYVRAVGSYGALLEFQRECHRAIQKHWKRVDDLLMNVDRARAAAWKALDEIGASVPRYIEEPNEENAHA